MCSFNIQFCISGMFWPSGKWFLFTFSVFAAQCLWMKPCKILFHWPKVSQAIFDLWHTAQKKKKHTFCQILLFALEAFQLCHSRRNNFQIKVETFCIQVHSGGVFLFFGKLEDKTSNVLLDTLQPTLNYMKLFPHMHAIRHLGKTEHIHIFTHAAYSAAFILEVHPDWSAHVDSLGKILINAHVAKGAVLTCKKT